MRSLRKFLFIVLVAVVAANAIALPAAFAALTQISQAASADCDCDDFDCKKDAANCASASCLNGCANFIAGVLPQIQFVSFLTEVPASVRPETFWSESSRPPPLPPPIA